MGNLSTGVLIAAVAVVIGAYLLKAAMVKHAGDLVLQKYEVHNGDGSGASRLRVAQLSDIHYDDTPSLTRALDRAVSFIRSTQPDVIFLTGDYVHHHHSPSKEFSDKWIPKIKEVSSAPIIASLGNHDRHYPTEIAHNLSSNGVTVLQNQVHTFIKDGRAFHITGLVDKTQEQWVNARSVVESSLKLAKGMEQVIILSHNPDTTTQLRQWIVDFRSRAGTPTPVTILSGHTHGGQICYPNQVPILSGVQILLSYVPFLSYFHYFRLAKVVNNWNWVFGKHTVADDLTLIISRGVGSHLGLRLFCPPDVTVVDFL